MPVYEYQCQKCGEFEITQRITDPALERCPNCRRKVKKLISSTSFQLKGTGWYVTDYARNGKTAGAGKASKESTSSAKSESSGASETGSTKESTKDSTKDSSKAPTSEAAA